jgi:hypothetical protein
MKNGYMDFYMLVGWVLDRSSVACEISLNGRKSVKVAATGCMITRAMTNWD